MSEFRPSDTCRCLSPIVGMEEGKEGCAAAMISRSEEEGDYKKRKRGDGFDGLPPAKLSRNVFKIFLFDYFPPHDQWPLTDMAAQRLAILRRASLAVCHPKTSSSEALNR